MDVVFVVGISVLVAFFGGLFIGKEYGSAVEQQAVARVLAEYHNLNAGTSAFVARILGSLKRDYRRAYDAVVDEVDQLDRDLKKAL